MTYKEYKESGKYNDGQLIQIALGLKEHLDITLYDKPEFSALQMHQMRCGLRSGVDMTVIADPSVDAHDMLDYWIENLGQYLETTDPYILLKNKMIFDKVDKTLYTEEQLKELTLCVDSAVFLPMLLHPEYSAVDISMLADNLIENAPKECWLDFSWYEQFKTPQGTYDLAWPKLQYFFKDEYASVVAAGYNYSQAYQLLKMQRYAQWKEPFQRNDVRDLLKKYCGLVTTDTPVDTISFLFDLGMQDIDVSGFWDPRYSSIQLKEIAYGIDAGIDPSAYASASFTVSEMVRKRYDLMKGAGLFDGIKKPAYRSVGSSRVELLTGEEADNLKSFDDTAFIVVSSSVYVLDVIDCKYALPEELPEHSYFATNYDRTEHLFGTRCPEPDAKRVRNCYGGQKSASGLVLDADIAAEIDKGVNQSVLVSFYGINGSDQDSQIQWGLSEGLDMSAYEDSGLSTDQMCEIRWALRNGVDVADIVDSVLSPQEMHTRWLAKLKTCNEKPDPWLVTRNMQMLPDLVRGCEFDREQMNYLYLAAKQGLFLPIIANPEFTWSYMDCMIDSMLTSNINEQYVSGRDYFEMFRTPSNQYSYHYGLLKKKYAGIFEELITKGFSYWQVWEILEAGTDVKSKITTATHPEVIKALDACQRAGIDASVYWNPQYSTKQFQNVYAGIMAGIDVSKYADVSNDSDTMLTIRYKLMEEKGLVEHFDTGRKLEKYVRVPFPPDICEGTNKESVRSAMETVKSKTVFKETLLQSHNEIPIAMLDALAAANQEEEPDLGYEPLLMEQYESLAEWEREHRLDVGVDFNWSFGCDEEEKHADGLRTITW